MSSGFIYLIGAGPGNPDLLTLRALKAIEKSDIILYDALLEDRFKSFLPSGIEKYYVGKRCGKHSHTQAEINSLLIHYANKGKVVARLKGGDPFIFGRGGEELLAIKEAEIPFEVIPGVSSMSAAAASSQIPITHRGISRKVILLNGHGTDSYTTEEWFNLSTFKGTIVVFMGTKSIQFLANKLLDHGSSGRIPVALVENASMKNENIKLSNLNEVAKFGFDKVTPGPGIIYIGEVINLFHSHLPLIQNESFIQ